MELLEYFNKKNLVDNMARYEANYQISLGKIIKETNISNDMSYEIEFSLALGSLYDLFKDIKSLDNIDLTNIIDQQSALDALQYFVNKNYELVKDGTIKLENIINDINDEAFFSDSMKNIYELNISDIKNKYKALFTDNFLQQIQEEIQKEHNI